MDERLDAALKFANLRHTLYLEKQRLQEKLKNDLSISYNGGRFYLDRNFIMYVNTITPEEGVGSATILDDKMNPIYIENLTDFRFHISRVYNTAVNQYAADMEELKKKRSVKSIVNL